MSHKKFMLKPKKRLCLKLKLSTILLFFCEANAGQRRLVLPPIPSNLNLSSVVWFESQHGMLTRNFPKVPQWNQEEEWVLCLQKTNTNRPVQIKVSDFSLEFWMPQHQHGLPTVPKIDIHRTLPNCLLVSGVRFHMPGWWQLQLEWKNRERTDLATMNWMVE